MARLNSLRTAVVGTALLAAIVVPASTASAMSEPTRSAPARPGVAQVTIRYDVFVRTGRTRALASRQFGRLTFGSRSISNRGVVSDFGAGYTVVTFTGLRRNHRATVDRFRVDRGDRNTRFSRSGRDFYRVDIRVCKYRRNERPRCDTERLRP
jgi:hypothetical protein